MFQLNDSRYGNPTYLTHSALSNFVTYDVRGIPTYSVYNLLNQTQPSSPFIEIGFMADDIITGRKILADHYTRKEGATTKAEMLEELSKFIIRDELTITDKSSAKEIKAVYEHYFPAVGLDKKLYDPLERIVNRSYNFQYSKTETFQDVLNDSDCQVVLQDDKRKRKGKPDGIRKSKKLIWDIKCVGNLDRFLQEIQYAGRLNITHKYPRQLAYYNDLTDTKDYDGELFVIDHTGRHIVIHIPNAMLRSIQEEFTEPAIVKLYTILEQDSYVVQFEDPRTANELLESPIIGSPTYDTSDLF